MKLSAVHRGPGTNTIVAPAMCALKLRTPFFFTSEEKRKTAATMPELSVTHIKIMGERGGSREVFMSNFCSSFFYNFDSRSGLKVCFTCLCSRSEFQFWVPVPFSGSWSSSRFVSRSGFLVWVPGLSSRSGFQVGFQVWVPGWVPGLGSRLGSRSGFQVWFEVRFEVRFGVRFQVSFQVCSTLQNPQCFCKIVFLWSIIELIIVSEWFDF